MTPLRQRMLEELQRRNYTTDTIRGYILAVEQFALYFRKSPELMGAEEIGQFQLHLLREKKLAVGTIALRMGALRFLYNLAPEGGSLLPCRSATPHGRISTRGRLAFPLNKR